MKQTKFNKYHTQVNDILLNTDLRQNLDEGIADRLENYCKTLRHNQFVTVLNVKDYNFTFQCGVQKALGFDESEFTAKNLIGHGSSLSINGSSSIIHPDDIAFYLHYGMLLYKLINKIIPQMHFSIDHAWFRFRLYSKTGELYVAEYTTFLHEATETGQMLSHVDIWTIHRPLTQDDFMPDFGFFTLQKFEEHKKYFFELNEEQLGIKFSPRQIAIVRKLALGLSRKETAAALGIGEGSINTHVNNMKAKVNNFRAQFASEKPISNVTELLRFARLYKLLR